MTGLAYLRAIDRMEELTPWKLRERRRPLFEIVVKSLPQDLAGDALAHALAMGLLWVEWREEQLAHVG
jgi:hypothetical protein